jgi:uncharacterized membrane protein YedE/YeeE
MLMQLLETYGLALAGGAALGLSASMVLYFNGRVAGVGGLYAGTFLPGYDGRAQRVLFLVGLVAAGLVLGRMMPVGGSASATSMPLLVIAGLLVGYGVRLSNGCTSGHGICGMSRLSVRSTVATMTFMTTGMITVAAIRMLGGAQ